jgi:hypothetical protein
MITEVPAPKIDTVATSQVIVDDYHVHPQSGHITITVTTHTKTANSKWKGETKQYGCDIQTLRDRFAGDIQQFENWVAAEHKSMTGPPPGLAEAVMVRKGRVIG